MNAINAKLKGEGWHFIHIEKIEKSRKDFQRKQSESLKNSMRNAKIQNQMLKSISRHSEILKKDKQQNEEHKEEDGFLV